MQVKKIGTWVRWRTAVAALVALSLVLAGTAACTTGEGDRNAARAGRAASSAQGSVARNVDDIMKNQPIPYFGGWSQEWQTILDTLTIRAKGTASTSEFYLEGVGLVKWCPSIGSPVPMTFQSTATQQYVDLPGDETKSRYSMDQQEPTGAFVGPTAATWTICLDDDGKKFGQYWEGPVGSTIGIVQGLPANKRIHVDQATFKFTDLPKK